MQESRTGAFHIKPVYMMAFGALLWILQLIFALGGFAGFHAGFGTIIGHVLLYIVPGALTFALLRQGGRWSRTQCIALAFGLGIVEALVIGQVLVIVQAPVNWLALIITGLSAFKGALCLRRMRGDGLNVGMRRLDLPTVIQMVLLGSMLFTMLANLLNYTTYTANPTDSWNYTRVKIQFIESPFDYPYDNDIVAHGINKRLFINPWLYNQAMIVDLLDSDALEAQQRDSMFPIYGIALLVYVALGRELSRDRQLAWLMAFLQIGFVLVASGSNYAERVSEDKFFSYFVFIPIIYMVFLRYLRTPEKQDFQLFVGLSVGAGLLHPINPLMLFATIIPLLGYRAIVLRQWQAIKAYVPVVLVLSILLVIPVVIHFAYTDVSQGGAIVGDVMAESRDVGWDYRLETTWGYMWTRTEYHLFYLLLFTVILWQSLRAKDSLPYQFVFAISTTILLLLWVPPFAFVGVKVLTQSQNWRIFMLLPVGYGVGLVCWMGFNFLKAKLPSQPRFSETALRIVCGVGIVVLMNYGFEWTRNVFTKIPEDTTLTLPEQQAFRETATIIDDSRVLASYKLSRLIPILWPQASTPFAERAYENNAQALAFQEMLLLTEGHDANRLIWDDGIQYLILSYETPLRALVDEAWPCCERVYANDVAVLYRVRYDVPYGDVDVAEIEHPLALTFGELATLKGANIALQDQALQITLYWEAVGKTEQAYTGFVHLMGDFNPATGGPLWGQDDHLPALGQISPETWALGRLYRDPYRLDLAALPTGEYTVAVGLYDSMTHERLMHSGEDGTALDSYALLRIQVDEAGQVDIHFSE